MYRDEIKTKPRGLRWPNAESILEREENSWRGGWLSSTFLFFEIM